MMYESPIKLNEIGTHISEGITKATDEYIFAQVNMAVDVDKEELIKALSYDRNQYQKGYVDGYADAIAERKTGKWIPVTERLPEDGTWNIFSDGENISVERYKMDAIDHFFPQGRWFSFGKAIAWMPLPEPYKGGAQE